MTGSRSSSRYPVPEDAHPIAARAPGAPGPDAARLSSPIRRCRRRTKPPLGHYLETCATGLVGRLQGSVTPTATVLDSLACRPLSACSRHLPDAGIVFDFNVSAATRGRRRTSPHWSRSSPRSEDRRTARQPSSACTTRHPKRSGREGPCAVRSPCPREGTRPTADSAGPFRGGDDA